MCACAEGVACELSHAFGASKTDSKSDKMERTPFQNQPVTGEWRESERRRVSIKKRSLDYKLISLS